MKKHKPRVHTEIHGKIIVKSITTPGDHELREKRILVFGKEYPRTTSVLSDLCICSGIKDYWTLLPKMTPADGEILARSTEKYRAVFAPQTRPRYRRIFERKRTSTLAVIRRHLTRISNRAA